MPDGLAPPPCRAELRRAPRSVDRRAGSAARKTSRRRSRSASSNWCASPSPISTACCAARRWSPPKRRRRCESGVTMTTTLLAKDTAHKTVFPVFTAGGGFGMAEMQGGGDFVMVADPATFRVLPWAPNTGWLLCDIYFTNGKPVPFSTRQHSARRAWRSLRQRASISSPGSKSNSICSSWRIRGLRRRMPTWPPAAPEVSLLTQGYQYLTESRFDQIEPALGADLARRRRRSTCRCARSKSSSGRASANSPSARRPGLAAADTMMLFRAAAKQIARRHGCLASFMCRPALPNLFSSGWHLHQSLIEREAASVNAFAGDERDGLSAAGRSLPRRPARACARGRGFHHADRQRLQALPALFAGARSRDLGARQSRRDGARARPAGRSGDASGKSRRRAGGQSLSLHRLADLRRPRRHRAPPRSRPVGRHALRDRGAGAAEKSRRSAQRAARRRDVSAKTSATAFVDYFAHLKEAEFARFTAESRRRDGGDVTAWEQNEYFDLF